MMEDMKVLAVLNQKGGAGKTTIATHLARAAHEAGNSTILIDSDPQGSARDWAAVSDDNPVMTVGLDRPTHARDIKKLSGDLAVIDGAPQAAELAVSASKAADVVLIPVQPSPYDVWAAADLVELVKQRIEITDGELRAAFVVSRAIVGTNLSKEVPEALREYELPVLETMIHQRQDYPKSAAAGLTVLDMPGSRGDAAREIRELWEEVEQLLNGETR